MIQLGIGTKIILHQIENLIHFSIYTFALSLIIEFGLIHLIMNGWYYLISFNVPIISLFGTYIYFGYVFSFIIWGSFLIIINKKFRLLSIPLFISSYVLWEVFSQGVSIILHTQQPFFIMISCIAVFTTIMIDKYCKINISIAFLFMFWVTLTAPILTYQEPLTQITWCIFVIKSVKIKWVI